MPFKRPTTTPTPDELFDEWLVELGEAELKILLYIIRRTMGFKKNADAISYNQFLNGIVTRDGRVLDRGCGVRNRTNLARALGRLEDRTLIRSWKRKAEDGDADVTVYALSFEGDAAVPDDDPRSSPLPVPPWSFSGTTPLPRSGSTVPVPPSSSPGTTPSTAAVPPVVPQQDLQETGQQQTDLQGVGSGPNSGGSEHTGTQSRPPPLLSSSQPALLQALLNEGVSPSRAADVCARFSPQAIAQQLSWLDGRHYSDRAACLVAAIEQGYGPPVPSSRRASHPMRHSPAPRAEQPPLVPGSDRYSHGPYGVCPACGCSPCDDTCALHSQR